ncbi:phage gateway protein [Erwinia amylovora]|uniref:phage gateway protein n=1 Tax=Erwinia amylovora TaxID=552 RepID=UPI001443F4F4|nr:hypothetical protein [Erwinia amylovora]
MTDNEVYTAIRHQILAQMNDAGLSISVVAGFQSTKQGREEHSVMFFPVGEAGHGWQARNYHVHGTDANHRETQLVEKTLQVQGLASDVDGLTATDLTATVRMIVNSLTFVEALKKQGVGVQRASGIRTPYFINDRGDYEQNPSFDFNVTFHREIFPNTTAVKALYLELHRI